jgi:hypothetical protein
MNIIIGFNPLNYSVKTVELDDKYTKYSLTDALKESHSSSTSP